MMRGDASKRLADALAKISQLRERLAQIEAEQKHHAARFARYVAECREKFERTKAFEDEIALLQAEIVRDWHERHATDPGTRAKLLYGIQVLPTAEGEAFEAFAKEHPNWRTEVEAALSIKVEIANQAHEETLATVRKQLSGFDEEAVTNDPRVKRARYELARRQTLFDQFTDQKDLPAWKLAIEGLFSE
jgi:chromosome segregation ATPase